MTGYDGEPVLRARLKIQCTAPDGRTGTFLLDAEHNRLISPLCRDLVELYRWTHAHGWQAERTTVDCTDYVYAR